MDHWTELAWEAERDEADAYQAAADAAEGERLRVALLEGRPNQLPSWADPWAQDDYPPLYALRLDGIRAVRLDGIR